MSLERGFTVFPVTGIPELRAGDDLAELIAARVELEQNDIVVVAQKAISKVEGRVVRVRAPLVICETRHGFICASAGVDQSNTPEAGTLVLLPLDPDGSAARLRDELRARTERDVGVLISDSFGRPWRQGTTDVAIGASGVEVLRELSGEVDPVGYELKATVIAVADELAGAAQLVAGKLDRVPVVIVRGLAMPGEGKATDIPIPPERDLFG